MTAQKCTVLDGDVDHVTNTESGPADNASRSITIGPSNGSERRRLGKAIVIHGRDVAFCLSFLTERDARAFYLYRSRIARRVREWLMSWARRDRRQSRYARMPQSDPRTEIQYRRRACPAGSLVCVCSLYVCCRVHVERRSVVFLVKLRRFAWYSAQSKGKGKVAFSLVSLLHSQGAVRV